MPSNAEDQPEAETSGVRENVDSSLPCENEVGRKTDSRSPYSLPTCPEGEDDEVRAQEVRLFPTRRKGGIEIITYSKPFADHVCSLVAEGWLLSKIAEIPGMPSVHTVMQWRKDHPEFVEAYSLALQAQAEYMADKAVEVADQSTWKTAKSDALKIEVTKWRAEKADPEKFGNKKNDHGNTFNFFVNAGFNLPDSKPIPIEIDRRDPSIVLGEKNGNQGDSLRVSPPTSSDGTETEGEKV